MTRDWSVKNTASYPKEIIGTGQLLALKHIIYEVRGDRFRLVGNLYAA
jgi:hypothetical protein